MNSTVISVLGGLGAMLGWGTSDFFANQATDKVGHYRTFFWSQLVGLVLILIISLAVGLTFPFNAQQIVSTTELTIPLTTCF